ncbi:LAMI_0F14840g1_1 [Lachancea mirantina]|uniref:LAMI_0F14840g1_1 n=1 Tax=Lachancea mirantina TaxID=1230905 RepID=A0A1G4K433_9SACH|nr:LAMI_0F14840g1_1 [Lachancea mirantina]
MKACYYELLGVQSDASDSDLKKAYRKQALVYHPDKNRENIEEATDTFAAIRAAYEVLSDPQERAWYDSHKDQILNDDLNSYDDNDGFYSGEVDPEITGTTIENLLRFFNPALYTRIDDTAAGLYQIAGKVFAKLATEEVVSGRRAGLSNFNILKDDVFESSIGTRGYGVACAQYASTLESMLFPPFGVTSTDYELIREFYKKWSGFSTTKSFSWKDEYIYSRNYDRKTKREINKRNEKLRQQAKSEYNKTVKRFVAFVKKLDKRVKEGAKKLEQERRRKLQESLKRQIQKDREANLKNGEDNFKLQSWQTVDHKDWEEFKPNHSDGDDEPKEIIIYECFLCNKNFKSPNQLENHNSTKLHKRKMKELQREMREESLVLGLDAVSDVDDFDSADEFTLEEESQMVSPSGNEETYTERSIDEINAELERIQKELEEVSSESDDTSESPEIDDLIDSDTTEANDLRQSGENFEFQESAETSQKDELAKLLESLDVSDNNESADVWNSNKKARRKARQRKGPREDNVADQLNVQTGNSEFTCGQCQTEHDSRNALFRHIDASGHASHLSKLKNKINKSKKKKSKK